MTHNPTDSNGVPYAMSHEVRAEREAIIAHLRAQAVEFDAAADYYFGVKQAIPAYNMHTIAVGLRLAVDHLENGWDIRERADPLAVANPSKGPLVWGVTSHSAVFLAKPERVNLVDAYYVADNRTAGRYENGDVCIECVTVKGLGDGIRLIIEWATEDGYDVPPFPYALE